MLPINVPSDASQKKVLRAFHKLGFEVLWSRRGKGSHRVVRDPKTNTEITVQYHIYKDIIRSYCKAVEVLGYDASEFARYL